MGYLLTISLILHFVCFYFLIILYQRQKNQQPLDKEKILREMEDLLVAYTTEMKENNERLAKIVARERKATPIFSPQSHQRMSTEKSILHKKISNVAKQGVTATEKVQVNSEDSFTPTFTEETLSSYVPPIPEDNLPPVETSPVSQILSLHRSGLPVNEIAKKLNMGAGEVELLIKIHK